MIKNNQLHELESSFRRWQAPSWSRISSVLTYNKTQYSVHKPPLIQPILIHVNPFHSLASYFGEIHFNIIFLSTSTSSRWLYTAFHICFNDAAVPSHLIAGVFG